VQGAQQNLQCWGRPLAEAMTVKLVCQDCLSRPGRLGAVRHGSRTALEHISLTVKANERQAWLKNPGRVR
jgi:N6-adenosine-specific RNA methylase IME4